MSQSPVLIAPSVEYESINEFTSSCEDLLQLYYDLMCDAVTRMWLKRKTTPTEIVQIVYPNGIQQFSFDLHLMCIASFEDALVRGVEFIQRTTKGQGMLYAHSMNMEIIREMNTTNHIYFYRMYTHSLEELLRTLFFALRRVILDGRMSHFALLFRENFVSFGDGDVPWLICPQHKVIEYKLAILMSHHERLGNATDLQTLPMDIIDILIRMCYTTRLTE